MKSSALKLLLIIAAVTIPLLVWTVVNQPQDVRSRADDSTTPTATGSLTPTATPSATLTPTATATPTVTPSLTPTPTNTPPLCLGISAKPGAGSKPLTVRFSCAGYDTNNDITAAEFGFGAGKKQLVEKNIGVYGSFTTEYTYASAGSYDVTCRVRDASGVFSDYPSFCKYTIVVSENALTPTPIRTPAPTRPVPTSKPAKQSDPDAPVVLQGDIKPAPTVKLLPTGTVAPIPTLMLPSGSSSASMLWTDERIRQIAIMLGVSAITIAVALALHSYFDKR